ncbi:hypothetical protein B0T25DRAFT_529629 [Lasiosphaeria hispida]|uniref:Uncharacterized protein n=1 Tax=Lasiosphaeria hispida TaxID=260671 RepID=A0AAJ0HWK6_9PEZI|nr:hypothetical protein B0T25DRAFT_529629 [Lasiosphaeria hispida]
MSWMAILSAWLSGAAGVALLILVFTQHLFKTQTTKEVYLADLASKERIAVLAKEECELAKEVRLAELASKARMRKEALASKGRSAVREMEKDVILARLAHDSPEAPASLPPHCA